MSECFQLALFFAYILLFHLPLCSAQAPIVPTGWQEFEIAHSTHESEQITQKSTQLDSTVRIKLTGLKNQGMDLHSVISPGIETFKAPVYGHKQKVNYRIHIGEFLEYIPSSHSQSSLFDSNSKILRSYPLDKWTNPNTTKRSNEEGSIRAVGFYIETSPSALSTANSNVNQNKNGTYKFQFLGEMQSEKNPISVVDKLPLDLNMKLVFEGLDGQLSPPAIDSTTMQSTSYTPPSKSSAASPTSSTTHHRMALHLCLFSKEPFGDGLGGPTGEGEASGNEKSSQEKNPDTILIHNWGRTLISRLRVHEVTHTVGETSHRIPIGRSIVPSDERCSWLLSPASSFLSPSDDVFSQGVESPDYLQSLPNTLSLYYSFNLPTSASPYSSSSSSTSSSAVESQSFEWHARIEIQRSILSPHAGIIIVIATLLIATTIFALYSMRRNSSNHVSISQSTGHTYSSLSILDSGSTHRDTQNTSRVRVIKGLADSRGYILHSNYGSIHSDHSSPTSTTSPSIDTSSMSHMYSGRVPRDSISPNGPGINSNHSRRSQVFTYEDNFSPGSLTTTPKDYLHYRNTGSHEHETYVTHDGNSFQQ